MFFNKLQCCLYSKLRYVDDTFLFGNSCCLERAARYITYIVVDRTRGVNMLFVVFVWVGAHQHRQADRGIIKKLVKIRGYAFLFLLFLIEKLLKSLLFLIFFFVSRVSRLCSENYWNALRILKRAHIFFFWMDLVQYFLSTLHTVTHWVIFTNFLSLNLKICCSKLQSCPKYFGENRVRDCAWINNKKGGSEHIIKSK